MNQDKKTIKHSDHDEQDVKRKPSQQQQGGSSGIGGRQQQQQSPGSKPTPGGGEPEVQEDVSDRDSTSERGSRTPQVDVERE